MTQPRTSGPDPMDGIKLALLQQNADQLRKQLRFSTFGAKEVLMLIMLAIGILFLLSGRSGSRRQHGHGAGLAADHAGVRPLLVAAAGRREST